MNPGQYQGVQPGQGYPPHQGQPPQYDPGFGGQQQYAAYPPQYQGQQPPAPYDNGPPGPHGDYRGGRDHREDGRRHRDDRDPRGHEDRRREYDDRGRGGSGGDRYRDRDRDRRGGRDDRDRDRERGRDRDRGDRDDDKKRKRSPSPYDPSKRRRATGWDQVAPTMPIPPPMLPAGTPFMNNPAMLAMQPPGAMVQSTVPRQQRRLYVGNLPPNINPPELMGFLNMTMANTGVVKTPGNPVVDCIINHEKAYAFVEFRTPSEATAAMSFDGLVLQGQALRVRRPKDYVPMPDDDPNAAIGGMPLANLDIVSTNVEDTPNKIFIGGIPAHLNESEIKELLTLFGKLKSFNLVRDSVTSVSKGFAFCEYFDPSHTDPACKNLNGMKIGEKVLVVQRAAAGKRGEGLPSGDNFGDQSRGGTGEPLSRTCAMILNLSLPTANMFGELARQGLIPPPIEPTKVVVLMNVVDISTEWDDNYYDEVFQDMQGELTRFGKIVDMKLPRPPKKVKPDPNAAAAAPVDPAAPAAAAPAQSDETPEVQIENPPGTSAADPAPAASAAPAGEEKKDVLAPPVEGFGKVYVVFEDVGDATRAQRELAGRKYDGRMVMTAFYPEAVYNSGKL